MLTNGSREINDVRRPERGLVRSSALPDQRLRDREGWRCRARASQAPSPQQWARTSPPLECAQRHAEPKLRCLKARKTLTSKQEEEGIYLRAAIDIANIDRSGLRRSTPRWSAGKL